MSESNALLVERFRANDPSAFAELFGRYHALVFKVCMQMLQHRQDAEDVTQETFSRVARYIHRWDTDRPIEPWLVTIAGNRCRTHLARRKGKQFQPLSVASEPSSDQTDQLRKAQTLEEEVTLAMSSLPENQRRVFELFHRDQLNYAEIAAEMRCPVGTVKTWVHRARLKLVEQLRQRKVLEGDGAE